MMSLLEFYERFRPKSYSTNWHHKLLCDQIQKTYELRQNLIVDAPPRHAKSEIVNMYSPAWRYLTDVNEHVGLVCNSDSLAKKFSIGCRNIVSSLEYQKLAKYKLEIDRDSEWKIRTKAKEIDFSYKASGIRGQITGHGFSTLIFDDLLKSGQDAKSDTVRNNIWENIVSVALNRLTPTGIVIALQARFHQDDTIGKLLATENVI